MEDTSVCTEVSDVHAGFWVFSVGIGCPQLGQASAGGSWGMKHLSPFCAASALPFSGHVHIRCQTISLALHPSVKRSVQSEGPSCWTEHKGYKERSVAPGGCSPQPVPQVSRWPFTCFCGGMWWESTQIAFRKPFLHGKWPGRCFYDVKSAFDVKTPQAEAPLWNEGLISESLA